MNLPRFRLLHFGVLTFMVAVSVAGCANAPVRLAVGPSGPSAPTAGSPVTSRPSSRAAGDQLAPAREPLAEPHAQAGVRAAAARFDRLYFAGKFAVSWDLLAQAARSQVPKSVWVMVHEGCPPVSPADGKLVTKVTVFGTAAILTETLTGTESGSVVDVFNDVKGRWGFSPGDLSVYKHQSIAADVAAAKAAGFCHRWKTF